MYKPLSDSTLMSMTKRQIIEILRMTEHNFFAAEEALVQQAENVKNWVPVVRCSECKYHRGNEVFHFCKRLGIYSPDDSEFFCKYGEKRVTTGEN